MGMRRSRRPSSRSALLLAACVAWVVVTAVVRRDGHCSMASAESGLLPGFDNLQQERKAMMPTWDEFRSIAVGGSCSASADVQSGALVFNVSASHKELTTFRCLWVPAPLTVSPKQQCCCHAQRGDFTQVQCLPHVVVAGAQKSGSTALYGFLLHHPNFSRAITKETHFFDFEKGGLMLPGYLREFPATSLAHTKTHVTGEATPAYVLGMRTADKMKRLIPHAKVLVILRNPVDRFYSEYQMKQRRVDSQIDIRHDGEALGRGLYYCTHNDDEVNRKFQAVHYDPTQMPWERTPNQLRLTLAGTSGSAIDAWRACVLKQFKKIPAFTFQVHDRAKKMFSCMCTKDVCFPDSIDRIRHCFAPPVLHRETLPPLRDVLKKEIVELDSCTRSSESIALNATEPLPPSYSVKYQPPKPGASPSATPKPSPIPLPPLPVTLESNGQPAPVSLLRWGDDHCWPAGTDSNIAKDFLVRGVYYPQLLKLYQSYPKSQVLVLDHDKLLYDPEAAMYEVHDFLGLPRDNVTEAHVDQLFHDAYPTFEHLTGWRMNSSYAPLPHDLREILERVYKPHNEQLFALLGRRFSWGHEEASR